MPDKKKYTPSQIKTANWYKSRKGKFPSWFVEEVEPNYADSLKQRKDKAMWELTQGKATSADSAFLKTVGVIKEEKPPKPKTSSELLRESKALLTYKYGKRGKEGLTKAEIEEATRYGDIIKTGKSVGGTTKKDKPEDFDKRIAFYEDRIIDIDAKLARTKPVKDEDGVTIGYEPAIADDMAKRLIKRQDADADSIRAIEDRKQKYKTKIFFNTEAKRVGLSPGTLKNIVVNADQIYRTIIEEANGLPFDRTTPDGQAAIKEYLKTELEKRVGVDPDYLKYIEANINIKE